MKPLHPLRLALLLLLGCIASTGRAADHFLTIGGGYSPTGNQISLEKNVLMFRSMLQETYGEDAPHDVLFSDGDNPGRDIQFQDPKFEIPKAQRILAQVFRQERYLTLQYRTHEIPGVRSGTSKQSIEKWIDEVGKKLTDDDRLFVYVTAHGGRASNRKEPHNTGLYLWNNQKLAMRDFATMLDRLPEQVPVVVIMVQCYSGGFADIAFENGDRKKGASKRNRCGFFATVHNRVAAGCTPDIDEANYQEYSSYFWAALRGKSRVGEAITDCDYDEDGRVCFAEAHAYALLESNTIDISVRTSDAFLRAHSRTAPDKKKGDDKRELTMMDISFEELLRLATPDERAILDGISTQLNLTGDDRVKKARQMAGELAKKVKAADSAKRKKDGELMGACRSISSSLRNRWPELSNRWHPEVDRLLREDADELVRAAESHAQFKRMQSLRQEVGELLRKKLSLDKEWAKTQRLIRTAENIVLAANLPVVADQAVVDQFDKLRNAERQFFGEKK